MVNYQNSKIYILKCLTTKKYIVDGTCKKYLSERLTAYVNAYNNYKNSSNENYNPSYEIIKNNNYKIELLEIFPCHNIDELNCRKYYYKNMFYIQEKEKKIQRLNNKKKESKIFYKENKILYNYLNRMSIQMSQLQ